MREGLRTQHRTMYTLVDERERSSARLLTRVMAGAGLPKQHPQSPHRKSGFRRVHCRSDAFCKRDCV